MPGAGGTAGHEHHGRRHHRHKSNLGAELVSTGARRRFRALPWRWLARITGAVLLVAAAVMDARALVVAALALAVGLAIERLLHRPVPLERDRSRRHLRRNLAYGLTTSAAVALYAFAVGDPTSALRTSARPPEVEEEDRHARGIAALGGSTALATIALSLLLFGFDRSADRRARRRKTGRGRDAAAPA